MIHAYMYTCVTTAALAVLCAACGQYRYMAGNTSGVSVASDAEAVSSAVRQAAAEPARFLWAQLYDLSTFYFKRCVRACVHAALGTTAAACAQRHPRAGAGTRGKAAERQSTQRS